MFYSSYLTSIIRNIMFFRFSLKSYITQYFELSTSGVMRYLSRYILSAKKQRIPIIGEAIVPIYFFYHIMMSVRIDFV